MGTQLGGFYKDLADPLVASSFALVHSRFSTNTLGSWKLAHPLPLHRPQWRDQHAAGQHQLDGGAPERHGLAGIRRRS